MPRPRRYDEAAARAALAAQLDRLQAALAGADPAAASRLPDWSVGTLDAHLGWVLGLLPELLAGGPAAARRTAGVVDWFGWLHAPGAAERIAARTGEYAEQGRRLADVADEVRRALAEAPAGAVLGTSFGAVALPDYLVTRLVEATVHGRDLPEPVSPDRAALRLTAQAFADVLAARHPGRSVELRVVPDVAVQCGEGPVHTRGTPPNVVETDPLTWMELAAGRLSFAAAVADARVTASGSRADLSAYLPLV